MDPSASNLTATPAPTPETTFQGTSEMHRRCRAFDWSATSLGPVSGWSQSLRTTAGIVLGSRNPMFLWWGPELVQLYNDAYRPSLGEDGRHPRALGMRAHEFWTDIWEAIGPQIEQVMTTGEATWHENQYLPIERNGRLEDVWWTYSYSPVRDDDGSIAGTLVVCQETTRYILTERERMRAETQRGQSESRYRTLFESIDEGFCVFEVMFDASATAIDYRFVEANPAFEQQTGLSNVIGRRILELVPDLETHWLEIYGRIATTGKPERFDAPAKGLGRWYDAYAFRIGDPDERRVAVIFNDVTALRAASAERDRLLRALRLERARLAYVFEHAPSFLAVLRGPDFVFELVNEAYYQLVGRRELLGKPLFDALPDVRGQGFESLLHKVLTNGEDFVGREIQVNVARTPGSPPEPLFIDLVYLPLVEEDGTRAGVIAHGTDVTEQVKARREIERLYNLEQHARATVEEAYRIAESANRAKAEFLAVMSHELRTPLNAIGGYAELLEMGIRGPVTPQQTDDLRRIQTSQRHLLGLINEVLNYAKLETGTVQYDVEDVHVREVLTTAESLVAPQARSNGLTLTLAACPPTLVVRADAEKLRQILVNLLSNAIKFTPAGGRVEMTCAALGDVATIRVGDTGIGIPADKLQIIFDPFVQVRSDLTRPHEGTGLGLAISRDLARGMGGDLTVRSVVGEGSTFTLTLPLAQPPAAEARG
jgi:PAS domain S-box-containing protein